MRLHLLASLLGSTGIALGVGAATPTDPQAPPPGFGCHAGAAPAPADAKGAAAPRIGLIGGLGDGGYAAEQVGPQARPYFEEGVRLAHDFDAWDAIRAFKAAEAIQPDCAMCFWGEAWAEGPIINYSIDEKEEGEARAAALKAKSLSTGLSPKAAALIDAALARYPAKPVGKDPASDDRAYAKAMEALAERYPGDDAIVTEAASALLVASGKAWREETPQPGSDTARAQAKLETVLARSPTFTPAIHFYIHLMEWTHTPDKAAPYAERLGALAPNAGHLVHMPSHLWFRMGRYEAGADANTAAVAADGRDAGGLNTGKGVGEFALHGHNVAFGLASALMSGDRDQSLALANHTLAVFKNDDGAVKAYQALSRDGSRSEVLALKEPATPARQAMWRYGRGLSALWSGDRAAAAAEAAAMKPLLEADHPAPTALAVRQLALNELNGRIALAEGRLDDAVTLLRRAADARDAFDKGMDPPNWGWPPRRALAAALLLKGDRVGAARELEASLKRFQNDPLALYALSEVKRADGGGAEADRLLARAKSSWKGDPRALRLDRV